MTDSRHYITPKDRYTPHSHPNIERHPAKRGSHIFSRRNLYCSRCQIAISKQECFLCFPGIEKNRGIVCEKHHREMH